MKKFIGFCLAVFLLAASLADAKTTMILCGGPKGEVSPCTTQTTPSDMETSNGTFTYIGQATAQRYVGTKITADATTGTICKICANFTKVGSPVMNFSVQIWGDTVGSPNSADVKGNFGSMNAANIVGSFGDCFSGASFTPAEGTVFWVMFITDAVDGSHYIRITQDDECATEHIVYDDTGSGPWADSSTARCGMVKLYK